jgi:hypothetical protein
MAAHNEETIVDADFFKAKLIFGSGNDRQIPVNTDESATTRPSRKPAHFPGTR